MSETNPNIPPNLIPLGELLESATLGLPASKLEEGPTPLIRVSDLPHHAGRVSSEGLSGVEAAHSKGRDRATVRPGDVVLVARGAAFRAGLVGDSLNGALAAGNLMVLRPRLEVLLGGYLVAFLNSEVARTGLWQLSRAARAMMSLSTRDVLKFEIPVLPMGQQRGLADLVAAADEYSRTSIRAAALRTQIAAGVVEDVVAGRSRLEGRV
jgi:hypothetical protein